MWKKCAAVMTFDLFAIVVVSALQPITDPFIPLASPPIFLERARFWGNSLFSLVLIAGAIWFTGRLIFEIMKKPSKSRWLAASRNAAGHHR
jgi:hypothetical protein